MRALSVLLLVGAAAAARLQIGGSDAEIALGSAAITSTCAGDAHVTFVSPQSVLYGSGPTAVRAYFHGVPHTCIDAPLRTPCVSANADYPSLFYATWSYAGGGAPNVTKGPLAANMTLETTAEGINVGYATWLDCPLPTLDELLTLTNFASLTGTPRPFALAIRHFAPSGVDSLALPFLGVPDGDQISLAAHEPPSLPPGLPPAAPHSFYTSTPINGLTMHGDRVGASPSSGGSAAWSFSLYRAATVRVEMWGAGGGGMTDGGYIRSGGGGAYVNATFSLAAHTPVYVTIGAGGGGYPSGNAPSGGVPGGGDGGSGPNGAGGGGCTILSTEVTPSHSNVLAVAGGGGGASRWNGNAAGYPSGLDAAAWSAQAYAGKGGEQSRGGSGGDLGSQNNCGGSERGGSGAALQGGKGGNSCISHGGGGGGGCGYFGGGGGRGYSTQIGSGGGGGGSAYVDTSAGTIVQTGTGEWATAGGAAELTATPEAAGVTYGQGGSPSSDGDSGFIVISVE